MKFKKLVPPRFIISLGGYFDCRVTLSIGFIFWNFYFKLPLKTIYDETDHPQYGFYLFNINGGFPNEFWIRWGRKNKVFYFPWAMTWVRTSYKKFDWSWVSEYPGEPKEFWDLDKWRGIFWERTYPYTYILNSGEIQNRKATVRVVEREWRPIWFKWTKKFASKRRVIDIEFNKEVGEKSGSWKGGIIGCSYDLKPHETPLECLRRMEKERKL